MEGLPLNSMEPVDAVSVLISEAITTGDIDFIKSLLQQENIVANGKNHSCWLLREAIDSKNTEIVSTLLKHGVCVQSCSSVKSPHSALHEAVIQGCVPIIKELIPYQGNWKKLTKNGNTVLHLAFNNNYLYKNYVPINKRTEMRAESEELIIKIIKLFLDAGMDVNVKNRKKHTPLFLAASHKMINVAKYLLERGAKISDELFFHSLILDGLDSFGRERNSGTWEPKRILRIEQDNVEFFDWLLSQGFNVDHKNHLGKTPLQLAVEHNQVYLLPTLLKYANDLTFQGTDRNTTMLHVLLKSNPVKKNMTKEEIIYSALRNRRQDIDEAAKLMINKGISMDSTIGCATLAPCIIAAQQKRTNLLIFMLNHENGSKVADLILPVVEDWVQNHNQLSPGMDEVISILISKGVLLRWQIGFKIIVLLCAAKHKFNKTFEALRTHGVDMQLLTEEKENLLHIALKDSVLTKNSKISEDSVRFIIERGCDVNATTSGGRTPLHEAVSSGNLGAVKVLIENRANINAKQKDGKTPLHLAVTRVNVYSDDPSIRQQSVEFSNIKITKDIVRFLIEKGCDLNCKTIEGMTALHEVALFGNVELARILIDNGADINAKQCNDKTPLHLAPITCGPHDTKITEPIVRFLIEKGCDVNSITNHGRTPLHEAAEFGQVGSVKVLIDNKADIEAKEDICGYTPFLLAAKNTFKELVDIFIEKCANVNVQDNNGFSALHLAITEQHEMNNEYVVENMIKLIIQSGCNVNHKSINGKTALHVAVSFGKIVIVKILIKNGAHVNAKDNLIENTPLHIAVSNNFDTIAEVLIKSGADINARQIKGQTPIHTAIINKRNDILKTLLRMGANSDAEDNRHRRPLELALECHNKEAVECLLEYGIDFTDIRASLMPTYNNIGIPYRNGWDFLFQHCAKLQLISLPYPKVYQPYVESYNGRFDLAFLAECNKLKYFIIEGSLTMYDFLHMNPNRRFAYAHHKKFQNLTIWVTSEFPLYHGIILASYRDAIIRKPLRGPAKRAWMKLTKVYLPDICIERIIDYCSTKSLKVMADWMQKNNLKRLADSNAGNPAKKIIRQIRPIEIICLD